MQDRIYKPGELIAHLQVMEHLATGGFSAIYKVHDHKDNDDAEPAAVKISRFDLRTLSKGLRHEHNARLQREYGLLRQLMHQCIVRAEEYGVHEGAAFYVMELLDGPTLGAYLAEKRRSYSEVGFIFQRIASALAHAHRRGVVHRDLKPGNIIIERRFSEVDDREPDDFSDIPDDASPEEANELSAQAAAANWPAHLQRTGRQPVLIDFGIAQAVGVSPITGPGALLGTAEYLSPEYAASLLRASQQLPRAPYYAEPHEDIYQAGVILYAMLTGQLPTKTPSEYFLELLREIHLVMPRHPRELNPDAPPALSELAMLCLSKRAKDRPADGADLLWRVNAALNEDQEWLRGQAPEYRAGEGIAVGEQPEELVPAEKSDAEPNAQDGARGAVVSEVAKAAEGESKPETRESGAVAAADIPRNAGPVWRRMAVAVAAALLLGQGALMLKVAAAYVATAEKQHAAAEAQRQAAEKQREVADAQLQMTRELFANAMRPVAQQLTERIPPPTPGAAVSALTNGLKMPTKPDPRWLKPGPDGVCREPTTGERLVAAVYRGTCWQVGAKTRPGPCPADLYEPPPEAEPRHRDNCFVPYMPDLPTRSVTP